MRIIERQSFWTILIVSIWLSLLAWAIALALPAQELRFNPITRKLDLINPSTGPSTALGRYSAAMASASSWSIPGSTHGLGTCALAVALWVGGLAVEAGTTSCNSTTFDVVIPFTSAVAGDVFLSSDPVLVTDSPWAGSLVSQVVAQSVNASTITITHNLNGVVLLRCYTGTNQRLGFNVGTVINANSLTVDFIGSVAGSSYCIAAR